jgi:lysylphosphatidylglycerol synthetase-like protein (DUF2156 family)
MNEAEYNINTSIHGGSEACHGGGVFTFSERVEYLKKFGRHSMAFSALQDKMRYFDVEGIGYIAYRRQWGSVVCLGDPVCSVENRTQLLTAFFAKYSKPVFIQVTKAVADLINELTGFYATQFGKETTIDLQTWTTSGKKKQVIRTAVNHAVKDGITVKESYGDMAYRNLSDSWLQTRKCKGREIIFLIRPMEMDYKEGTRRFFAYKGDEMIGFVFFDPIYENGEVIAYVPNISRASEKFPQGIFYMLMAKAFEQFKEEGIPYVFLGLSPLALDNPPAATESKVLRWMLEFTANNLNFLYNFKGIDFTKSRFRGVEEPTYAVHKGIMPSKDFVCMFRICNVI